MTPVTASSHHALPGNTQLPASHRYCLSASKGACGATDDAQNTCQQLARRQNLDPDRRSAANHRGHSSPYSRRCPDKSP